MYHVAAAEQADELPHAMGLHERLDNCLAGVYSVLTERVWPVHDNQYSPNMERMIMKILRTAMVMTAMLSAIGLTACGRQGSGPAETAGKNVDQAAQTVGNAVDNAATNTGQALSDTAITSKVKAAIFAEPGLKTLQINVETTNGMVTLTGTVNSQRNSDKAVAIAGNVEGVKGVSNRLTVVPNGSG